MSFLTEIKNFIKTEILGTDTNNTKTNSVQLKHNNAIIECETEKPVDKFEKKASENKKTEKTEKTEEKNTKTNQLSQKALEETISNIPAESVNIKKMIKEGLIEKVTGCSKEAFEQLPQKSKLMVLRSIQMTVKKYETLKTEGKINKDANIEELIISEATNTYQALSTGAFKSEEEYEAAAKNFSEELGKEFDKRSKDARRAEFKKLKVELRKEFEKQLQELENLPKEQRETAKQKLFLRHKFIARKHFLEIAAERKSETAVDAMLLLHSEDLEYGAKTIISTRRNQEIKTKVADYANYSFTKELIQSNAENGEKVKAEILKGYTQTFMENKSADAAFEYQADYTSDRKLYENALRKKQNGESLTEEEKALLSYMETEYYTASAQGIGEGALNNINMTSDQKAEFISTWDNDAKQFSDYEEVTATVKDIINNNVEYKEVKEKLDEIASTTQRQSRVSENNQVDYDTEKDTSTEHYYFTINQEPIIKNDTEIEIEKVRDNTKSKKVNNAQANKFLSNANTNPIAIIQKIKNEGVEKAISKYGTDAIQVILDTSALKYLRPKLTTAIRSFDLNTLFKLSESCSNTSFVFLCSIVNNDYVEKLIENREKTKKLCHSAENQVKKMENKNATV